MFNIAAVIATSTLRDVTSVTEIPEISLAAWRQGSSEQFARDFVTVCHEIGFLTLVDHGVSEEFIERYFAGLEAFFALPDEVKAHIDKRNSPHFRGWERIGAELTDNKVDYREQLDVLSENPAYPPGSLPAYLRLDGPNQWLGEDVIPGFKALVMEFFTTMQTLGNELMGIIAIGLGLPHDTFLRSFGEKPLGFTKMISYPPTPEGMAGVNVHNDAGFLTILLQNGVGGLQALSPNEEWIDVPPKRGSFVINLGEMLQTMTGNYLVATKHRVISREQRFSSAYFHGPDLRTALTPLELDASFAEAVAKSPRHRDAGFMAKRDELLAGKDPMTSAPVPVFGEMMWNYYVRSYPEIVAAHYPDFVPA